MAQTGWDSWLAGAAAWLVPATALLALIALALAGWMLSRLIRLERKYDLLTRGTDGGNLQQVLEAHMSDMRQAQASVQELDTLARGLERSAHHHVQRVGFLRFNPFRDAGGDQSFALAVADQDGNGFVLSSLHSRDVTRVYGKPLAAWESVYPLTDEEQQAIGKAKAQL